MNNNPYDSLRQELERRREEAQDMITKIDRALAALAAPGVAELLAGHGAVTLPPPLLTVRKANQVDPPQPRRVFNMGRSQAVFAALSTGEAKNSVDLEKELGMSARDIRGALKVLYDRHRVERRGRGYYVRRENDPGSADLGTGDGRR